MSDENDFLRASAPDAVELRGPCEVCAPEACRGHIVVTKTPGFAIRAMLADPDIMAEMRKHYLR